MGDGIINAPLVFDVAVHLYLPGHESTTVTNWSIDPCDVEFKMSVHHSRDNSGDTYWGHLRVHLERRGSSYFRSMGSESDFDFYGDAGEYTDPGSSHGCDIDRRSTISEHFLDG